VALPALARAALGDAVVLNVWFVLEGSVDEGVFRFVERAVAPTVNPLSRSGRARTHVSR
jgi:hypothetical protein